jgi:hypothetical protein
MTTGQDAVQGALMADRAEQETGEAAVSTRPDDQQGGVASLLDEHLRGLTHAHYSFDLDVVCLFTERGEGRLYHRARVLYEPSRINVRNQSRPSVGNHRYMPGRDHPQPHTSYRRFVNREAQRVLRAL